MTMRLRTGARREEILAAALKLAEAGGFTAITQRRVADAIGIQGPTIQYHYESMAELKDDVFNRAVENKNLRAIGWAIAAGYSVTDLGLRAKALQAIWG